MFPSAFVCLLAKTTQPIFFTKLGGKVAHGPRKKPLIRVKVRVGLPLPLAVNTAVSVGQVRLGFAMRKHGLCYRPVSEHETQLLQSVSLSATFVYCIQTAKDIVKLFPEPGNPIISRPSV